MNPSDFNRPGYLLSETLMWHFVQKPSSAFHALGWISRNHPLLRGLWGQRPNRRSVLRRLDWLWLIPQLRQRLQMAPFVELEKGRKAHHACIRSHFIHLLVLDSSWTWSVSEYEDLLWNDSQLRASPSSRLLWRLQNVLPVKTTTVFSFLGNSQGRLILFYYYLYLMA